MIVDYSRRKEALQIANILGGRVIVHDGKIKNYQCYAIVLYDGRVFDYSLKWWYATEAAWHEEEDDLERFVFGKREA